MKLAIRTVPAIDLPFLPRGHCVCAMHGEKVIAVFGPPGDPSSQRDAEACLPALQDTYDRYGDPATIPVRVPLFGRTAVVHIEWVGAAFVMRSVLFNGLEIMHDLRPEALFRLRQDVAARAASKEAATS